MKNTIILIILLLNIDGFSQITLDFQTPALFLENIKLDNSESKYFEKYFEPINSLNQFSLYNLDGSLYKTIQLPPKPDALSSILEINFITKSLFDNDSSNIEYLVAYRCDSTLSGASYRVKIIREDGTILLDLADALPNFGSDYDYSVYNTEEGAKLVLFYYHETGFIPYQTKVFHLTGKLPNGVQDNLQKLNNILSVYPNPNNGSFFINLHSNDENSHIIDLYSTNGKLVDTYKSSGPITHVNNFGLSDGLYLINTRSRTTNLTTKMIIKK